MTQRGAVDDARVEEVADAGGRLLAQDRAGRRPGPDVALHEERVALEVRLGRGLDLGRGEGDLDALVVDVAIARDADDDDLAGAVQVREGEDDVLERVRRGPRRRTSVAGPAMPDAGASRWAFAWSTSVWIVGVFGESKITGSPQPSNGTGSGATVVNASTFAA